MKRTVMKRAPYRSARSALRRADDQEFAQIRKLVFERDVHCVMCDEQGEEVHHRLPRGAGGALHDPTRHALSRLVLLCRDHHEWCESYRSFAVQLGLLVPRGVTPPAEVPVFRHKQWCLLDDHGCVLPCERPTFPAVLL